jgi:hypothetical protein
MLKPEDAGRIPRLAESGPRKKKRVMTASPRCAGSRREITVNAVTNEYVCDWWAIRVCRKTGVIA